MKPSVDDARARRTAELVTSLLEIVGELEELYPGRRFTPDGHLVGSLGETAAAALFDVELVAASSAGHDAVTPGGRKVEIKATFGNRSVAVRRTSSAHEGALLVVLRLSTVPGETHEVVYDGPLASVLDRLGPLQSNGASQISLSRLRALDATVPPESRVPRRPAS